MGIQQKILSSKIVRPMVYAYTTPEIPHNQGWLKIGYTESQTVEERIRQQTHTVNVKAKEEWRGNAVFEDGTGDAFTDQDFHRYLESFGIERREGTEWFHIDPQTAKNMFREFRENRGVVGGVNHRVPYKLRKEQLSAVEQALAYKKAFEDGKVKSSEYLWNAKPRFGKTLSAYDLCQKMDAQNVLIVTNRPAISDSWYNDYMKFLGEESGYCFVSHVDILKGKPSVYNRKQYVEKVIASKSVENAPKCIEFISLQDLKGSVYFGGHIDKLEEVANTNWDILIIDEAHEAIDTYKTDKAFNKINRKFTLHLSGTAFKAIANEKFLSNAIYNWTYVNEQRAKQDWGTDSTNPYAVLPRLNLYSYQMSELIKDKGDIDFEAEPNDFAFDLNEFFSVRPGEKTFVHNEEVKKFIKVLTTNYKLPFSDARMRNELKHSLWMLERKDSAEALKALLEKDPVFSEYRVILAVGDGKANDDWAESKKVLDKVKEGIAKYDKTITISVGQLTTGITIPEWTAVFILSNIQSAALFFQAGFRAQNPCLFKTPEGFKRKENAYIFDFDSARTLIMYEKFANDLISETSEGKGDLESRKQNIEDMLNYFPVVGEDDNGELVEYTAEQVLSVPRKVYAREVVNRGFMSNLLFQDVAGLFSAPPEVIDILQEFEPASRQKVEISINSKTKEELSLDEEGNVSLSDTLIEDVKTSVFESQDEEVVKKDIEVEIEDIVSAVKSDEVTIEVKKDKSVKLSDLADTKSKSTSVIDNLKKSISEKTSSSVLKQAEKHYGKDLDSRSKRLVETEIKKKTEDAVRKVYDDYEISMSIKQKEIEKLLSPKSSKEDIEIAKKLYEEEKESEKQKLIKDIQNITEQIIEEGEKTLVKTVETTKREKEKDEKEEEVRDKLRGFARTIPSFIMAYGDENLKLSNFDTYVPASVFKEVTSISIEDFIFLRDGGNYTDKRTGELKYYKGKVFNEAIFNDSVQEFLRLKKELSDYFDDNSTRDIFDYIPPQKTNQIFTPKKAVLEMVCKLELENPGCFDNSNFTFLCPYSKSGLFVTEIVKKLYRSRKMKELFPDNKERLKHIFENQVYAMAPTEITCQITKNFLFGFDEDLDISDKNVKVLDLLNVPEGMTANEYAEKIFFG